MTITPGAGNWLCVFSADTQNSNAQTNTFSIYVNGVQIAATQRGIRIQTGAQDYFIAITTLITGVLDGQAIDVRWRVTGNTATVNGRELTVVRAL
jgi:hypothetical protein